MEDRRKKIRREIIKDSCKEDGSMQNVHTPYWLCKDILNKVKDYVDDFRGKSYLVMFNLEFVEVLICMGVNDKNITFMSDSLQRRKLSKYFYDIETIRENGKKTKMGKKQFDVVIGNPPYQRENNADNNKNESLWDKFVKLSIRNLSKSDGYICMVHPPAWRKPEHKLWPFMTAKNRKYL